MEIEKNKELKDPKKRPGGLGIGEIPHYRDKNRKDEESCRGYNTEELKYLEPLPGEREILNQKYEIKDDYN